MFFLLLIFLKRIERHIEQTLCCLLFWCVLNVLTVLGCSVCIYNIMKNVYNTRHVGFEKGAYNNIAIGLCASS